MKPGQDVYHKITLKTGVVLRPIVTKDNTVVQALTKVAQAGHITRVRWDNGDITVEHTDILEPLELELVEIA